MLDQAYLTASGAVFTSATFLFGFGAGRLQSQNAEKREQVTALEDRLLAAAADPDDPAPPEQLRERIAFLLDVVFSKPSVGAAVAASQKHLRRNTFPVRDKYIVPTLATTLFITILLGTAGGARAN